MNETVKDILIKLNESRENGEPYCQIEHLGSDSECKKALEYAETYEYLKFVGNRSMGFSNCCILPKGIEIVEKYLKD